MAEPKTLTQIAGAPLTPSPLGNSALLVIDLQNEYQSGALKLDQLDRALTETKKLLALARANGVPVFHFQHKTGPGAPIFDPTGPLLRSDRCRETGGRRNGDREELSELLHRNRPGRCAGKPPAAAK